MARSKFREVLGAAKPLDPKAVRARLGINQAEFWRPVGVTQSGGSRYESGRAVPASVMALLVLRYGSPVQREKVLTAVTTVVA